MDRKNISRNRTGEETNLLFETLKGPITSFMIALEQRLKKNFCKENV